MPLIWKMMTSQPSSFDLLAPPIKRWVWKQGWPRLRDIQEKAIPVLLGPGDAIVSAPTAGGKTEAAFLPILTCAVQQKDSVGFNTIYIAPLKALINDQFKRLEGLCQECNLALTPWHGDIAGNVKAKALKSPSGVLLITPESLEALFMRKSHEAFVAFGNVEKIIVDEWHAFIGTDRGAQLISLCNRLEKATGRRIDRVGLSATLGDIGIAAKAIRHGGVPEERILVGNSGGKKLKLQIKTCIDPRPRKEEVLFQDEREKELEDTENDVPAVSKIASHIFESAVGKNNLVFGGSKQNVETYGAALRDISEESAKPNEFFVHHANISKSEREATENRLKKGQMPTTAVCTSTLELGIDIGSVDTVYQIGPSGNVASLRQRIGRSGRRSDSPIVLRNYLALQELDAKAHIIDRLYLPLIQAIAEVRLLLVGWVEPASDKNQFLSVLVHQILSLIYERGGMLAPDLFGRLTGAEPFKWLKPDTFGTILRALASFERPLIEQAPDGTLLLGEEAEFLTSHYSFYSVFETEKEFRVIHNGKLLGTVPHQGPAAKDMIIIFQGGRWKITEVQERDSTILVIPAKGGRPPIFGGGLPDRHKKIDQEIRAILEGNTEIPFICGQSKDLLESARSEAKRFCLPEKECLQMGDSVFVLPWSGSTELRALQLALMLEGYSVSDLKYGAEVAEASTKDVAEVLQNYRNGVYLGTELAAMAENKSLGKFDKYLTEDLLIDQLAKTLTST